MRPSGADTSINSDRAEPADSATRPLFRRQALEQLNSPAQLQEAIRIASPRAWLALLAVLMLLGAGLGWGVFGRIPTVVAARGVIVPERGYTFVTPEREGTLESIAVAVGDEVRAGTIVARQDGRDLVSRFDGRVAAITALPGEPVAPGAPLLTLEPLDPRRRVVVYLPLAQAARVAPGMSVRIRPLTAGGKRVDLRGLVAAVGEHPATRAEMRRALGSDEWVSALRGGGLVAAVTIEFDPTGGAGRTGSSASRLAPVLKAGAPCEVTIITGERSPLQMGER